MADQFLTDQFLVAHSLIPLWYEIGTKGFPISIKDQMIRGRMIVDRALEVGLIDGSKRPLLVVGAGAAGVTAAIHAAESGVQTRLIELEDVAFLRLTHAISRWLDPTEYDWPAHHWDAGRYPWMSPDMPLTWSSKHASEVISDWKVKLEVAEKRLTKLQVLYRHTISPQKPWVTQSFLTSVEVAPVLSLKPVTLGKGTRQRFGMGLLCTGFGTERCNVGTFEGYRFWDGDDYQKPDLGFGDLGLPSTVRPRVYMSGGGDGALQDFLRIVTQTGAVGDIYRALRDGPDVGTSPDWRAIESEIQTAEEQARRASMWSSTDPQDHEILDALHQTHTAIIGRLKRNRRTWSYVKAALQPVVRDPIPHVTLSHSCTHFDYCYPLNRFLVLLLVHYLRDVQPGRATLKLNRQLVKVEGVAPHDCGSSHGPKDCHCREHRITYCNKGCGAPCDTEIAEDDPYNVVIVRHGIEPPKYVWATGYRTAKAHFPPVLLPYHAPA